MFLTIQNYLEKYIVRTSYFSVEINRDRPENMVGSLGPYILRWPSFLNYIILNTVINGVAVVNLCIYNINR